MRSLVRLIIVALISWAPATLAQDFSPDQMRLTASKLGATSKALGEVMPRLTKIAETADWEQRFYLVSTANAAVAVAIALSHAADISGTSTVIELSARPQHFKYEIRQLRFLKGILQSMKQQISIWAPNIRDPEARLLSMHMQRIDSGVDLVEVAMVGLGGFAAK